MKRLKLIKTLLVVAIMLVGGANFVWAEDAETVVVNQNFDDGSTTLFAATSRITVDNDNNVRFTTADNSGNGYSLATYDFSSVIGNDATAVKIEFDYYIYNGSSAYYRYFTIGDKSKRTGFAKQTYVTSGGMFAFGLKRGKFNGSGSNTNFWSINNGSTANTTANIIGAWAHVEVTINLSAKTSTYKFTSMDGKTEYYSGSGLAYMDGTASNCNQIDFFDCANSVSSYLDNLKITKYWDCQASYTLAKAEYSTKVESLDAAGQAYWNSNTSVASVTDEASYNTAVAALPSTYIAAVKAQTTAGSDMTDAMPSALTDWTCSQGNGPGTYATTFTETYSNGTNNPKFVAGDIMSQTISGLPAGYYRVQFYGVVNSAWSVSDISETTSNLVQAYANSTTADIDVYAQTACTPTDYLRTVIAQVSDGTLTYGLKAKDGVTDAGNWAIAKTYSLTYLGSTLFDYTINYKFNDATISSTGSSAAYGETINATSPITISDTKYYATSATSMVIGEEPNVLNVTLREADNWSYTVRAVNSTAGVINDNLASGSVIEGEVGPKVFFPRYVLNGTTLYCNNTGTVAYSATVTPDEDGYVYDVNYNQTPVSNVAFYIEAEDVTGVSKGTNVDRASMGKMGYTGSADTYKDVTTLAPGKYILYSRFQNGNNSARTYKFKVGGEVVHTGSASKGTNSDTYSSEFTVSVSSILSFASEGSDQGGVDYFYLVKTAEAKTISSAGWATYCSPYPLDFRGDIDNLTDVFIITGSQTPGAESDYVAKTSVKGGTVPANTGLLIKGTTGTVTIPVATSISTDVDGNKLVGVTTNTDIEAGAGYVLMNDATNGLGFYKNEDAFTVGANTAYLPSNFAGDLARGFFSLADDEATGINMVHGEGFKVNGAVYNLNGQRIDKPTKGLYISGGKKFIVK